MVEVELYRVLFLGALIASYFPLREADIALNEERRPRLYILEVGAVFALVLWGAVALHSFDVTVTNASTVHRSYKSLALVAAAGAVINGLVFVKSITGSILPGKSKYERQA